MISVHFKKTRRNKAIETQVRLAAETALSGQQGEITFILCNDDLIHQYNRDYRDVDRSTDVLSFGTDEEDIDTGEHYLGDILISVEHAQAQAEEAGHPLDEEIAMLAIHGVLHLLGYDHATVDEKAEMWQKQKESLAKLGIVMDQFSGDESTDA